MLGTMNDQKPTAKSPGWLALFVGISFLLWTAISIAHWLQTGILEFTFRRITATGPIAYFEVALCFCFGVYVTYVSLRNLLK
jgi:hypothetical protein